MASTTIIRATDSFHFVGPNGPVSVRKGSTFHRESERLAGLSDEALERNFEPFAPDHGIETATAVPGEKRNARIRKPKPESTETENPAVEQADQSASVSGYSEMKQPELKALLDERGIEYPSGVVSNADLIALLESKPESTE